MEIHYQIKIQKIQKLAQKGFIRVATGEKAKVRIPPKLPGRPWREILKDIRE